ncbi:right-handed parallel beta-helix repeat-containing protein [Planctomycetota bacterium]
MKRYGLFLVVISLLLSTTAYCEAEKADFYVAANGSDENPGTIDKPFKTIDKARIAVRGKISDGLKNDVTVLLRGGTYQISEPIIFDQKDSGSQQHSITYANYPGEEPIISGGKKIANWKKDTNGRWKAKAGVYNFRQMYVNGKRAQRARGGTQSRPAHYYYGFHVREKQVPGGDLKGVKQWGDLKNRSGVAGFRTADGGMAKWRNQNDIEFGFYSVWCHMIAKVDSIVPDGSGAIVKMQQPTFWLLVNRDGKQITTPDYIENAFEVMDEPGEWYLDRPADTVYYIPKDGEDMTKAEVIAPAVQMLVLVKGVIEKPIRNLKFEGLTFAHGTWLGPSEAGFTDMQWNFAMDLRPETLIVRNNPSGSEIISNIHSQYIRSPAHVILEAAKSVDFERCVFTKSGGAGIDVQRGSQDNMIRGCEFYDLSGTAVQIGDVLEDDHHPKDERQIVKNNKVVNNYIHNIGVEYEGSVGVFLGYTDSTLVAHNEITDLPCCGISMGWGWGEEDLGGSEKWPQPFNYDTRTPATNNVIEYNHVHNVTMIRTEGGAIYTNSDNNGSMIRGNHIHDNASRYGAISTDIGTAGISFDDNLIYNVKSPNRTAYENVTLGDPNFPQAVADRAGLEDEYKDLLKK